MVEKGFSLFESCWADQALELLDRRQEVRGRISAGMEPGHHVRETWGGHWEKPRAGEVEIESKVWMLELVRGDSGCLVFLTISRVEKIKKRCAVRSKLLVSRSGYWLPHSSRNLTRLRRPAHFLRGLLP